MLFQGAETEYRAGSPERLGIRQRSASFREPFDAAALAVIVAVAAAAAFTIRDYGISNDEAVQHRYGELIVAYYASGFADRTVFGYDNLYLYGGLFDIVAVLLKKVLPLDLYFLRHILCTLIGIGGLIATWAAARLVAGPRAGFIAVLMLATTAQWYGAMFNHTKDIPFAAAMMGGLYFLLRAKRDLPVPRWRDAFGFGLCFGAACGLRALGLLLIGYLGLVGLARLWRMRREGWAAAARFVGIAAVRFLPGLAFGYALMLAAWPWAALDPLNPIRALFAFAHFHYQIRTIFAGQVYEMADVPSWYVPAYLLIRLPLLMWAGAVVAILFVLKARLAAYIGGAQARRDIVLLWFVIVFPVVCEAITSGPAFTGMRHFLFVVPPLAVLAGIGIDGAITWLSGRGWTLATAFVAVVMAAFLWEASLLVRLHPYEYLYYNALVGGLQGAAGRYEMDYWVNIMPEAVRRLEAYIDRDATAEAGWRYTVGVCGERFSFEHEASARLQWTPGWYEADFFITPTQMNCDRATNGAVVIKIERLGVLIGLVKDRRGYPSPAEGGK